MPGKNKGVFIHCYSAVCFLCILYLCILFLPEGALIFLWISILAHCEYVSQEVKSLSTARGRLEVYKAYTSINIYWLKSANSSISGFAISPINKIGSRMGLCPNLSQRCMRGYFQRLLGKKCSLILKRSHREDTSLLL